MIDTVVETLPGLGDSTSQLWVLVKLRKYSLSVQTTNPMEFLLNQGPFSTLNFVFLRKMFRLSIALKNNAKHLSHYKGKSELKVPSQIYIYKTPARKCLNIAWSQQEGGGRLTAGVRRERTPHIDKAGRGQTPTIDVSTPLL